MAPKKSAGSDRQKARVRKKARVEKVEAIAIEDAQLVKLAKRMFALFPKNA